MEHCFDELPELSVKCVPCHYCGSKVKFMCDDYENGDTTHNCSIQCTNEKCGHNRFIGCVSWWEPDYGEESLANMVDKWNKNQTYSGDPYVY